MTTNSFTGFYVCSKCKSVFRAKHTIEDYGNGYDKEEHIHSKKIADFENWSLKHEAEWENFTCPKCVEGYDPVIMDRSKPPQIKKTADELWNKAEKDIIILKKGVT